MNPLRTLLLTMLALFSASRLRAEDDVTHVSICNDGNVKFAVATAAKLADFPSGYTWEDKGWFWVKPGQCGLIFHHNYRPPVWMAFAFTDSKGVWGWIKVKPNRFSSDWKLSDMKMCAQDDEFKFVLAAGDLPSQCKGTGVFPIPSSIEYDPNEYQGGLVKGKFNVSISSDDRAIPFTGSAGGGHAPSSGASGNPGGTDSSGNSASENLKDFVDLLKAAGKAADERQKQNEEAEKQSTAQRVAHGEKENRERWAGSHQSPGAWDPQWMGQNIVVTGTVSRVEVAPGSPPWVTIYFKESPDATFVVCSPYPDMFQDRVGPDLSALVGKTLQAAGQVEGPYCGHKVPKGSIKVVVSSQWQVQ